MAQQRSFNDWMILVNVQLVKLCGMVSDDLPDYRYNDSYDRGETYQATAKKAIAHAKKDMGL